MEGSKRQAAIIFVIAGIFLVGILFIGLGIVKQQSRQTAAPSQQSQAAEPNITQKPVDNKKPAAQKEAPMSASATTDPQPALQTPPTSSQSASAPQAVPATGPQMLPATGPVDALLGISLLVLVTFSVLQFYQSKQALLPKL